jgi:hypothetical protein
MQVVEDDLEPNLGIAVCIAGQLSRLELESKVANIIAPLAARANVGVFVSLETGDRAVYDNTITHLASACAEVPTVETMQEKLGAHYVSGRLSPHRIEEVRLDRFPRLYSDHDGNIAHKTNVSRDAHISNVMSQLRHLKDCSELILAHEKAKRGLYTAVLKVRDNTLAVRPVSPEKLLDIKKVHTKGCDDWGGINDKTMVLHRRWLDKTLGAYYDTMTSVMRMGVAEHTRMIGSNKYLRELTLAENTEQLQERILRYKGVPLIRDTYGIGQDSEDILPFVDGRCITSAAGTDHWCTVWRDKDCWPEQDWVPGTACHFQTDGSKVNWTSSSSERRAIHRTLWSDDE